jgi:hypothetical protein
LAATSASRGDVEERLEAATARVNFSGDNLWRKSLDDKREGKKGRPERGREGGRDSPDFEVFARSDGGL